MKTVSDVRNEGLCLSCGACHFICENGAIVFRESVGGFLFPYVAEGTCVGCGLCLEVCPGIGFGHRLLQNLPEDPFLGEVLDCRVGKSKIEELYRGAQSGGLLSTLLTQLLDGGHCTRALVVCMPDGNPPRAEAAVAEDTKTVLKAQKSKYVPVPTLSALKALAGKGSRIAVVGLPCQLHGLNNLMDKCEWLQKAVSLKIGLVCERVQSNLVIDHFIRGLQEGAGYGFDFKNKNCFNYPGNLVVNCSDGRVRIVNESERMKMKDFFTPVRCRLCFDKLNVYADLVFGDPHGLKGIDRQRGEGLIIVRTQRGRDLLEEVEKLSLTQTREVSFKKVSLGQGMPKKVKEWNKHMRAWSLLGKRIPNYPDPLKSKLGGLSIPTVRHFSDIFRPLRLDKMDSQADVLLLAERWSRKMDRKKKHKGPIKKILRLTD